MVAAIRKILTVTPQGTLEIRSPELAPGTLAEVIVLLAGTSANPAGHAQATLQAWNDLQAAAALEAQPAQNWAAATRAGRRAFGRG